MTSLRLLRMPRDVLLLGCFYIGETNRAIPLGTVIESRNIRNTLDNTNGNYLELVFSQQCQQGLLWQSSASEQI